jgi:hypothetical protein
MESRITTRKLEERKAQIQKNSENESYYNREEKENQLLM